MAYASALYARASLATNADSAEQDYRRITVQYSSSPREPDALLRLAQLELARGDRELAAAQLARMEREETPGQTGVAFARTKLQVGLAYFDLQDAGHACAALVAARGAAPSTDVELRNRIDYNTQRCPRAFLSPTPASGVATSAATGAATGAANSVGAPPRDTARDTLRVGAGGGAGAGASAGAPSTTPRPVTPSRPKPSGVSAKRPAPPVEGREGGEGGEGARNGARYRMPGYTVQVAAYQTRAAAEALSAKLKDRGFPVRVVGAEAPYRVRIGRYTTEREADAEVRALKAKGIAGFVTEADPVMP